MKDSRGSQSTCTHIPLAELRIMHSATLQSDGSNKHSAKAEVHPLSLDFFSPENSPAADIKALLTDLLFLKPHLSMLQSVVLVGSTALGSRSDGSDIDIVLITRDQSFEFFCEYLFEKEIDAALAGLHTGRIEYTVLAESQVEKLFHLSSPFSYSIRHGLVLFDSGYLENISNTSFPAVPPREYYLTMFSEHIVSQYFSALQKAKEEIRQKQCSVSCCQAVSGCNGLTSLPTLSHLVIKMLYLTLPARGLMPLTKNDAVDFAEIFYSRDIASGITNAVSFIRSGEKSLPFFNYRTLRGTATKLFGEILAILGRQGDVTGIIRDAANLVRGNYRRIENAAWRNCLG